MNNVLKKSRFGSGISAENIIFGLIFIVIVIFLVGGLNDTADSSIEEGRKIAENSLYRAAASCYAFEGLYPSSYEYLADNYGVNVDAEKYVIHYVSFAPNLMPDIGVYVK
jgi:hypothetical protein